MLVFSETTGIWFSKIQQFLMLSFCSVYILLSQESDGSNVLWMHLEFIP